MYDYEFILPWSKSWLYTSSGTGGLCLRGIAREILRYPQMHELCLCLYQFQFYKIRIFLLRMDWVAAPCVSCRFTRTVSSDSSRYPVCLSEDEQKHNGLPKHAYTTRLVFDETRGTMQMGQVHSVAPWSVAVGLCSHVSTRTMVFFRRA